MEEQAERGWFKGGRGLTAGLIAGTLAGGLLFAPGISAAKPRNASTQAVQQQEQAVDEDGSTTDEESGVKPPCRHFNPMQGPIRVAAELFGVEVYELAEAIKDGSTIAAEAEAHGVDVQTVIDAIVADAKEHIAEAVASGRITQERADEVLATLEEHITGVVNGEYPLGPPPGGPMGGPPPIDGETTPDAGATLSPTAF